MALTYKKLISKARAARRQAYAPYSRFHVGAALLSSSGVVYTGCNVENSSYSLTMCAERTVIFKAISEGERAFKAIAIVANDKDFTPPCGACRQVLWELAGDIDIIMVNSKAAITIVKLKDLLPYAFDHRHLPRSGRRK